jgi:hypothetical protein
MYEEDIQKIAVELIGVARAYRKPTIETYRDMADKVDELENRTKAHQAVITRWIK